MIGCVKGAKAPFQTVIKQDNNCVILTVERDSLP